MVISEIDEEVNDYDWFAVDKAGRVGHFATGGIGNLPRVVAASWEDLKLIADFFRKTLPTSTEARLAPKAQEAANNAHWRKRWTSPMDAVMAAAHCFQDFMQMARRGLFSFDHSNALDCYSPRTRPCPLYYRIAIPTKPLHMVDLPMNVQTILNRCVFAESDFSHDDDIRVE